MAAASTHSFTIQHIDHIVLRVASLERAIAFYCNVLGCKVARRRDDLGLLHLSAGGSMIDLVALDGKLGRRGGAGPAKEGRNVDHLCLRVEPFDEAALTQHLATHNIPTHGPAAVNFGAEGEGLSLYLSDPDGNAVELKGPARALTSEGARIAMESVAACARIHWATARFYASFAAELAKNSGFWICCPPQCSHQVRLGGHAHQPLAAADDWNRVVPGAGKQGEQEAAYL